MVYFVSTAILAATMAAFFVISGRRLEERYTKLQWALRIAAAAPLVLSGTMHFLRSAVMAAIVTRRGSMRTRMPSVP